MEIEETPIEAFYFERTSKKPTKAQLKTLVEKLDVLANNFQPYKPAEIETGETPKEDTPRTDAAEDKSNVINFYKSRDNLYRDTYKDGSYRDTYEDTWREVNAGRSTEVPGGVKQHRFHMGKRADKDDDFDLGPYAGSYPTL